MHSRLNQVNENLSCSLDMGILINRLSSGAVFSSLSLRSMAGVSHVAGLSRTSPPEEALSQTCNLAADKGLVTRLSNVWKHHCLVEAVQVQRKEELGKIMG